MKLVPKTKLFIAMAALTGLSGAAHASQADLRGLRTSDFLMKTAPTDCQPKGLRSDREGRYAYVANMCGKKIDGVRVATVTVYNLRTMQLEKTIVTPSGSKQGIIGSAEVTFTLNEDFILASRVEGDAQSTIFPGSSMITAIDARTQSIKEFIPVNAPGERVDNGSKIIEARPMVAGDSREIMYVANYFSDDISVLNVAGLENDQTTDGSHHFVGKIKLHSAFVPPGAHGIIKIGPRGIGFTQDGRYAIVDNSTTGSIFIVDSVHHRQIAELGPIPEEIGAVPLRQQVNGKSMNVRHIVLSKDGKTAYLSHMRGDAVSRISVDKLIQMGLQARANGSGVIPSSAWDQLIIPFPNGKQVIKLPRYSADHPALVSATGQEIPVANRDWDLVRPNTIVLDPVQNRYLYVSCRTDTDSNFVKYNDKTLGKVDVIDTQTGEVIFSFVGGSQPTALEVTPDNSMLISGGFKDSKLYFFDIKKLIDIYER